MDNMKVVSIGKIEKLDGESVIVLDKKYAKGLKGLQEFGYVQVLWWMHECDNERDRSMLVEEKPYVAGPEELGVFAIRSPERPNPVAVSNAGITYVDEENGVVGLTYIDAKGGSPVIDLKPYMPSIDRVKQPVVPDWCSHWPQSVEESGTFDWEAEFNF